MRGTPQNMAGAIGSAMRRALPFTEAGLRRAISAARKEGLRVTGIRSDGTLILDGDNSSEPIAEAGAESESGASSRWGDVKV